MSKDRNYMSRLKGYLVEEKDNIIKLIQKDCKPFLKETDDPFIRYVYNNPRDWMKIKPRTNRKPKDTPKYMHDMVDKWFREQFGWKVRSEGVFTYPETDDRFMDHMEVNYVFPIGPFKYVYSKDVDDMYLVLYRLEEEMYGKKLRELKREEIEKIIGEFIKRYGKTYKDNKLKNIFDGYENEVVFKCKEYYLVNSPVFTEYGIKNMEGIKNY